jgi:hypothetical protein
VNIKDFQKIEFKNENEKYTVKDIVNIEKYERLKNNDLWGDSNDEYFTINFVQFEGDEKGFGAGWDLIFDSKYSNLLISNLFKSFFFLTNRQ